MILYILHSGNLYGTERMALATLAGMEEYDARVLMAPAGTGTASATAAAALAGFDSVAFQSRWQLLRKLLPWFLRYRSIDVIGTGVSQAFICYVISKLFFVRLRQLQVVHGGTHDEHAYGKKRYLERMRVRVIAVSNFVHDRLVDYRVPEEAITVIDNFLPDEQRDAWQPRAPYAGGDGARAVDPKHVRVSVVSRVDPIKRIDLLVEALEAGRLKNFRFDVYGTGGELEILKDRAVSLPNITFHGFVPDVNHRLSNSDFLLHLCPVEPFGLAILEAFASRVVAIVPNSGGAGDIVQDGVNGLRFAANDIEDLSRVLERAAALSPDQLQDIADEGRAMLERKYSQSEGLRQYRSALATPVSRHVAPGGKRRVSGR